MFACNNLSKVIGVILVENQGIRVDIQVRGEGEDDDGDGVRVGGEVEETGTLIRV